MKPIIRSEHCDGCNRCLDNDENVTALIPNIQVTNRFDHEGFIRLKLSADSINNRTLKIYCNDCLNLTDYLVQGNKNE
jgi:hypothetical protein